VAEARISLRGIHSSGHHGVNPGEKIVAQEFLVDLDVLVDVKEDVIEAATDYRVLAGMVRETVASTSFDLLETLADAVAGTIYALPLVQEVTVVVHKSAAASELQVDDVSAEVTYG
jgi:dihydroneopterin aldolase